LKFVAITHLKIIKVVRERRKGLNRKEKDENMYTFPKKHGRGADFN